MFEVYREQFFFYSRRVVSKSTNLTVRLRSVVNGFHFIFTLSLFSPFDVPQLLRNDLINEERRNARWNRAARNSGTIIIASPLNIVTSNRRVKNRLADMLVRPRFYRLQTLEASFHLRVEKGKTRRSNRYMLDTHDDGTRKRG